MLETCGLVGQANTITGKLPGGWKQRVALGASVMHEPEILFLDKPTSGVDPLARRQFWRLIRYFAQQVTAILVTTYYLAGQLIELAVDRVQTASNLLKTQLADWRVPFSLEDAFIGIIESWSVLISLLLTLLLKMNCPHS